MNDGDPGLVRRHLDLLLHGYGYNLYNQANRARADDLLVRERAASALSTAATRLRDLAGAYQQCCVPASTRENPFPPAERLAALKQLQALSTSASTLASRVRGMSAPTRDRVWARFRRELDTLETLLSFDERLILEADAVAEHVDKLVAEEWTEQQGAPVRALLRAVEQVATERERFLSAGVA